MSSSTELNKEVESSPLLSQAAPPSSEVDNGAEIKQEDKDEFLAKFKTICADKVKQESKAKLQAQITAIYDELEKSRPISPDHNGKCLASLREDFGARIKESIMDLQTLADKLFADEGNDEKRIELPIILAEKLTKLLQAENYQQFNEAIKELNAETQKLANRMEVSGWDHAFKEIARKVLGGLKAVLGAAIMLVTFGFKGYATFKSGLSLASSGPGFFQRDAAINTYDSLNRVLAVSDHMKHRLIGMAMVTEGSRLDDSKADQVLQVLSK